jgi:TfoX/Sxy family transcriptional regulator of competence genes
MAKRAWHCFSIWVISSTVLPFCTDWQNFLKVDNLVRINFYENVVADCFFQLQKQKRIKLKTYQERAAVQHDNL